MRSRPRGEQRCEKGDIDMDGEGLITETVRNPRKKSRRLCCLTILLVALTAAILAVIVALSVGLSILGGELPSDPEERALALLDMYPVIDGHNDLAYQYRLQFSNQVEDLDLTKNHSGTLQTDIPRLKAGRLGAQMWSAYMPCSTQYHDATRTFIDQMDIIKLFVRKYPDTFTYATSAAEIEAAYDDGLVASLIGVEGGHAIDSSLGTLRQIYELGGRYMTLTHNCDTPWARSSLDNSTTGLNSFGRKVVREMNRLGMMVDISHVNVQTMLDAMETSVAPVIFSHSSAYAVCDVPRNAPDEVLRRLADNGGIIMTTFVTFFVNCSSPENATVSDVADHIDHLREVAGIDHVGIGSDFDGAPTPHGLEDVSKFPSLFAELIRRGYSDEDVAKISRNNFLRVFKAVEMVRDNLKNDFPDNTLIDPQPNVTCRTDF